MTTQPRLLFMAQPQPDVLSALVTTCTTGGLDTLLGTKLFAPENWHQSLSNRYFLAPNSDLAGRFLRAGERIDANAVTLTLNRLVGEGDVAGTIHWAFRVRGEPKGFRELLQAVRLALREEGVVELNRHRPHLTISYSAPTKLPAQEITPINWTIEDIMLVEGGGKPYHYRVLGRWPLRLPPESRQLSLFE